ncbi:16S rRNA (guanine(527)-N(7))-methyltransferase RsmG [Helicobacter sp. faydin-H20]|uniref:16S rRNA (guanine(527)-N(7))-methyltransferase RsmG n=1 Tax=Helicobacter anatolicus TaxID=2905874 RepID=UPI001E355D0A|nr:16S rRNA (guanine(527)-N(7))-methyltransferase RsmG [Helicobacter anatolicus]MCE3037459.1 16S rRNA (guanine(527)-N(7))-methyltransferase RsmG [Helicobacter anatolicus]
MNISLEMKKKFDIYTQLLLFWNKTHNLGGNLNHQIIQAYLLDSVFPLDFIKPFKKCMDIGSGAGFPAIALAICREQSQFLLVEPRQKRYAFLQYVCMELGLVNVEVYKKRVEEMDKCIIVDLVTSRALMATQNLIALSQDFLSDEGYYLFYKGGNLHQEITEDISKYIQKDQRIYFYERKKV